MKELDADERLTANTTFSKGAQAALESILHEMVILESALLLRDKRYCFEKYPKLQWRPAQIAHDVIRLSSAAS